MSLFEPIGEDGLQYWEEMNFTYVGEADVTLRMIGPQALIKYRVSAPLDLELGANTVGEG